MSIADELAKLEELRRRGTINDAEFAQAKAALLRGGAGGLPDAATGRRLELLEHQNRLAQLDREWETERQQYLVKDRYGHAHVPTRGGSMGGGLVLVGFGTLWTIGAFIMAVNGSEFIGRHPQGGDAWAMLPWIFPIFGIFFVVAGAAMSISAYGKAERYEKAHRDYQHHRAEVLAEIDRYPEYR